MFKTPQCDPVSNPECANHATMEEALECAVRTVEKQKGTRLRVRAPDPGEKPDITVTRLDESKLSKKERKEYEELVQKKYGSPCRPSS